MKVIFLDAAGRAHSEDVGSSIRLIEEPDGIHPVGPANIYQNDEHLITSFGPDDSIALIFQGVPNPLTFGPGMTKEEVTRELVDDFILKLHSQKQPVSKYFWRNLSTWAGAGFMLIAAFGILTCILALAYAAVVIFLV